MLFLTLTINISLVMKTTTKDKKVKIQKLQKLAEELDTACKSGSIDSKAIKSAQIKLNESADGLIANRIVGDKAYIVYEVQGLIHWINGEYDEATSLIRSACEVKKDNTLYTESATALASRISDRKNKNDIQSLIVKVVGIGALILVLYFIGKLALFFMGIGWEYGS